MNAAWLPLSFWPLALAHGLALLSPGPDFTIIVSHALRYGWRGSFFICFGITLGNAAYIALAIAGWAGLGDNSSLFLVIKMAGAAYLLWLGLRLLRSARTPLPSVDTQVGRRSAALQLALGLGSAVLNPKNMVFYLAIMTTLIENAASLAQRIAAGVWMVSVVLLWDCSLAASVSYSRVRQCLWKYLPVVEVLCGAFLVCVSLSLAVYSWIT